MENDLPIVYCRGFAGPSSQIDVTVDDAFYGFNDGATHVRVNGDGDPMFYQFEGPLLRLMADRHYEFLVQGDQKRFLETTTKRLNPASIWVHRFYDEVATTFTAPPKRNVLQKAADWVAHHVDDNGFDIERAASELYDLIMKVREKTGAPKVNLVAHSMGGLVARCMIQKICEMPDANGPREKAKDIVAKLFTFGTPHGGIILSLGAANWAMETFGTAGSDIFAPAKMFGYLTPKKKFGEVPGDKDTWDPQVIPPEVFDADKIFCLIGTDPADYSLARVAVGPKSDGLVLIEKAYVRGAHRAYVYKSHSGRYGEVNSEEGYQNLARFLFGRWSVKVSFAHLPHDTSGLGANAAWQADMRLAIRGLPIIMSEQQAQHWCPIQLNDEIKHKEDSPDSPVPIVGTFLLKKEPPENGQPPSEIDDIARYALTLRVYKIVADAGGFDFSNHLEQVSDWVDSLIVDVTPSPSGEGLKAWTGWNSAVDGANDSIATMPNPLTLTATKDPGVYEGTVPLPPVARALPVFTPESSLVIRVADWS